ncbi:LLM class flavin-dependent oxidoreductase [Nocardia sp. R6R-6]|uniref:LLM class flavin-dependent oxidoreductase n=1 Tax=Nocardia sp. R6R-6 TaxID=3459303 RepID=UPI00403DE78D
MFLAPFHPVHGNPTLDLQRDLDLVVHLDELGFDEAYFGEHHSGGYETIGSPEIMIAAAAARTRRIRLGTGVVSAVYHHPFNTAERIVLLDHLTQGRVILGLGPGSLPSDTALFGIDYGCIRARLEEATEAIVHLLTSDEPLTMDTGWFKMVDARLNLRPFQRPCPEIVVAAMVSPSGPRLAGKHGLPLLSIAASTPGALAVLSEHWDILQDRGREFGVAPAPRSAWRMVAPMHIAETREQAERDVQFGIDKWGEYFFRDKAAFDSMTKNLAINEDTTLVDIVRDSGVGVIGTPDDAIELIERLQESSGGFGTFLILASEMANSLATKRSYELFAHYVIPHFQGQLSRRIERWDNVRDQMGEYAAQYANAVASARAQHENDVKGL